MAETKKLLGFDGKNLIQVKDKTQALTDAQLASLTKLGIKELKKDK